MKRAFFCFVLGCLFARFAGLHLHQRSKNFFCVRIIVNDDATIIEKCDIVSDHFSCIQIDCGCNPLLRSVFCYIFVAASDKLRQLLISPREEEEDEDSLLPRTNVFWIVWALQ